MLLGLLEHVAHARGADTDKHFDEVGTGNREERHFRLAGDGLRQQGLAGTRRADHQNAARNTSAEFLEAGWIAQELDQFTDFFLGFVATRDVGEGDQIAVLVKQSRLALAEGECAALAAALHLAHEEHPYTDQQQHREPGHEYAHQH